MSEIGEKGKYLPDSPYPGIEPFTYAHRNVFFAREREARALLRLVVIHRGVLLYSESGVGKSSVVNAGLIPRIMAEGFQPERLRIQPRKGEEIIVKRLSIEATEGSQSLPSLFAAEHDDRDVALSVKEFVDTVRKKADTVQPLLIFDQFEEWTTLFEEGHSEYSAGELRQMQQAILEAIVALLNDRELPVKLLIVLREDYLAQLTPLFERCPTLVDQYLRLTALDAEQVFRAIRGPFDDFPGHYQPEISAGLARTITTQFKERTRGADIRLTEVQIVCRSLFESAAEGSDPDQKFAQHENVQGLLEEYLRSALRSLPADQQVPAVELLTRMVTSGGTRKRISRDDLLAQMGQEGYAQKIVLKALDSLERTAKLVRRESLRSVYYYEIASEFLVDWIRLQAQVRRLQRAEVKAAEDARVQAQARFARRMRTLVVALAITCLLALGAAALALIQTGQVRDQKETAVAALATAYAADTAAATSQTAAATSQAGAEVAGTAAAENEAIAAAVAATGAANQQVAQYYLAAQATALVEQLQPTATLILTPTHGTPTPTRPGAPIGTWTPTPTATPIPTADAGATATAKAALAAELATVNAAQTAVAIQPLPGEGLVQMTFDQNDECAPSISTDQRTLLYQSLRAGTWQIFALRLDERNWMQLTQSDADSVHARFSPFGQRIAFSSYRTGYWEIFTMRPDGSDVIQLTTRTGVNSHPSYSRDGTSILFHSTEGGSWGVYVMDADGSQVRPVVDTEDDEANPYFSPDGGTVVFQADYGGNWEIYTVPTIGGVASLLADSPAQDTMPIYTPDGGRVVFETNRRGDYEIYVMNADGTGQRNLTNAPDSNETWPWVSPDGLWVLFQSDRNGNWDIFRIPLTE